MNIDELMAVIAERFKSLGADAHVARDLKKVKGKCVRILDKYSRFTPTTVDMPQGFLLDQTLVEGSDLVAKVSIDAHRGDAVPALVVRYTPE